MYHESRRRGCVGQCQAGLRHLPDPKVLPRLAVLQLMPLLLVLPAPFTASQSWRLRGQVLLSWRHRLVKVDVTYAAWGGCQQG